MKVILISVVLFLHYSTSLSQSRYVDLASNIISPITDDLINEGDIIQIQFYIKNQGPDSILYGDFLPYTITNSFRSTVHRNKPFNSNLAPGDSILFTDTFHMIGGLSGERIGIGFHSRPVAFSYNKARPLKPELYEDKDDNGSFVFVRYRLLSLQELNPDKNVCVFPNPNTTRRLTIRTNFKNEVDVTIQSISGEVILTHQLAAPDDTIDLKDLSTGLYLVCIQDESGSIFTKKLHIH